MPIYEYRCPDCGHEFELMRKMSDPPVTDCPSCEAANVRKLISRTAFQLKGGGWYSDHYGLKSGGGDSGGASGGASGGDSAGAATSTPSAASPPSGPSGDASAASTPAAAPAPTTTKSDS